MSSYELTARIRAFALDEAGFDLAGFSRVELPGPHAEALDRWVGEGMAGTMAWLERDPARRSDPRASLPSARSVISLAVNYGHPDDPRPEQPAGRVAKYAYGSDYHAVIEKRLKRLERFVREAGGPGTEARSYVDTGPVLEKAFAREAGLGFFGKNTNLITKRFGSWVFLASLLTNLELEADAPHAGSCGTCTLCIDACPTGALLGDYRLDARRCISYLTIESKDDTPDDLKAGVGEWLFGCDICQDVCPYNRRSPVTRHEELYPRRRAGTWVELDPLEAIPDQDGFAKVFQGSPLRRAKLSGMRRNAAVVRGNLEAAR